MIESVVFAQNPEDRNTLVICRYAQRLSPDELVLNPSDLSLLIMIHHDIQATVEFILMHWHLSESTWGIFPKQLQWTLMYRTRY